MLDVDAIIRDIDGSTIRFLYDDGEYHDEIPYSPHFDKTPVKVEFCTKDGKKHTFAVKWRNILKCGSSYGKYDYAYISFKGARLFLSRSGFEKNTRRDLHAQKPWNDCKVGSYLIEMNYEDRNTTLIKRFAVKKEGIRR